MEINFQNKNNYSVVLLIGIFVLFIYAPPFISLLTPEKKISLMENRMLAPFPKFDPNFSSIKTYPKRFESYFNDQFGLKESLIFIHNFVKVIIFKKSPRSEVIIGDNGWFFLKSNWVETITPEQLDALKLHLETKHNWLARKGIRYLFVPAPDKESIYPEHLYQKSSQARHDSPIGSLAQYLQSTSDIQILDLRHSLKAAKQDGLVYYLTDHHWNHAGAYIAYQDILKRMQTHFPSLSPIPDMHLVSTYYHLNSGTCVSMLGLADYFQEEKTSMLKIKQACSDTMPFNQMLSDWAQKGKTEREKEWYQRRIPLETKCERSNLKAIVFRDSFFSTIIPYFSEHFQHAVYIWTQFDYSVLPELIEQIKPDIVIEECQEGTIFFPFIDQEIHKTKGFDFLISGKTEQAVREFEIALKDNPASSDNYNNLGFALFQMRRFDEAILRYKAALRIDPDHKKAQQNFESADRLVASLNDEIIKLQKQVLQIPADKMLQVKLGKLLQRRGRFNEAIQYFHNVISVEPENQEALNNLAISYAAVKKYDKSVDVFQKVIALYPQKADAHYNLACIYALQKEVTKSVNRLRTAIDHGYRNINQIRYDSDLENIRKTDEYKKLLSQLDMHPTDS